MRLKFIKSPGINVLVPIAAVGLLGLTGCNQIDPLKRPYMWHETEVNRSNIAAMAVNPHDLVRGRGAAGRPALFESDAATRLWTGKALPLPSETPGTAGSTGSSGGGGSGGGGGSSSAGGGT